MLPPPTREKSGRKAQSVASQQLMMGLVARRSSPHTAVRCCGSVKKDYGSAELWRGDGGHVQVRGVTRCGSPWECPTCASRVGRQRAAELDELANRHRATGGEIYHLTLTVAHDAGLALKPLRAHVARAWRSCVAGQPWKRMCFRLGISGFVRALDVTVGGANGWHPHLHVLVFTDRPASETQLLELHEWIYARWTRAVVRPVKGLPEGKNQLRPPSAERGVVLRVAVLASYLAEASICWSDELASETMKQARMPGHFTPWQLLHRLALGEFPDARSLRRALAWWMEWAAGMRGARQLTYSKGLRERYGLRGPEDDAAAVDAQMALELGEAPRIRFLVPSWEWNHVVRQSPSLQSELMGLAADLDVSDADVQECADSLVAVHRLTMAARPPGAS